MSAHRPIRVTMLTPPGRAALATVAVDGPQAIDLVERLFLPASSTPVTEHVAGRIRFGHWARPDGEEVVVAHRGAEQVEIHGHGGSEAIRAMIDDLVAAGCDVQPWQAWIAEQHGDAIARDARTALALARTERTAGVLLDQLHGALRRDIQDVIEALQNGAAEQARCRITQLLARSDEGRHLTQPWRVVLSGRPNVGKSSLMNRMAGYDRAIVFDQPGTTRDVVTTQIALDGWPVELADTAGLREAADAIEQAGVERAVGQLAKADLRVLVFDASVLWSPNDQALIEAWPDALRVHNKRDLGWSNESCPDGIVTSARTGTGIAELIGAIVQRLVPTPCPQGEAVPFTEEQIDRLTSASQALDEGKPDDAIACLSDGPFAHVSPHER